MAGTATGEAGTVTGVAGTEDIEGGTTEAGTTVTGSMAPVITGSTAVGAGLPVDTIRGGSFRCQCHTRITDITVPVMDTDMGMGRVTGTDTDRRSNMRSIPAGINTVAQMIEPEYERWLMVEVQECGYCGGTSR